MPQLPTVEWQMMDLWSKNPMSMNRLKQATRVMTSSTMQMHLNSPYVILKTSMAISSMSARVKTTKVNGNARDATTSSSLFTPVCAPDGLVSFCLSALPRRPWATRISFSFRSVAFI